MKITLERVEKTIQRSMDLPTLPGVVTTLARMVHAPNVSAAEIGELISDDQSLTARVLRVVNSAYYGSIYPSVQNLLLAARAVGLGAALITLPLWSTFVTRRILGLPFSVMPCAVVPLGWPRGRYGPTTRRPVGEVVSLDRYGNRPFAAGVPTG